MTVSHNNPLEVRAMPEGDAEIIQAIREIHPEARPRPTIQSLELARAPLPGLDPVVAMWQAVCKTERFAVHPQTWEDLFRHFACPPEAAPPPANVVLRDDPDTEIGYLYALPPVPEQPPIRLLLTE